MSLRASCGLVKGTGRRFTSLLGGFFSSGAISLVLKHHGRINNVSLVSVFKAEMRIYVDIEFISVQRIFISFEDHFAALLACSCREHLQAAARTSWCGEDLTSHSRFFISVFTLLPLSKGQITAASLATRLCRHRVF